MQEQTWVTEKEHNHRGYKQTCGRMPSDEGNTAGKPDLADMAERNAVRVFLLSVHENGKDLLYRLYYTVAGNRTFG